MAHRIVAIGEVLWDLLPEGKQLGGAPANFTYHCRSLGADACLVTRIGDDDLGHEVLERFRLLGLPNETVQIDDDLPTGTVDVALSADGQPRFTIREHVAWDRITADTHSLAAAAEADAVCFGSLAQRSESSRAAVRALVAAAPPRALRLFDVNLRPPFIDGDVIADSLALANALKLNDQELTELARMFGLSSDVQRSLIQLADRFGLSLIALTRGANGSLLLEGGAWSDHPGHAVAVRDTIGAGDAFSAALVVGSLSGRPLPEINGHANAVAGYVCSQPGGTPRLPESLRSPEASESRPRNQGS